MRLDEYARRDGLGLADLLRAGEVAPRELAELASAAIEALNPHLNAVIDMVLSVPSPMYAPGLTGRRTARSLLPERCAKVFAVLAW